jgi:N-acetylglucosamine repressor
MVKLAMYADNINFRMKQLNRQPMSSKGKNLRELRNGNLQMLLTEIWQSAPISRTELVKKTGMAPSTITRLTSELCQMQLIEEAGKEGKQRGRQAILIIPNPNAGFVVGIGLDSSFLCAAIFDSANHQEFKLAEPYIDFDIVPFADQVVNLIKKVLALSLTQNRKFLGIGVSVPGIVNIDTGLIEDSFNLQLHNFPIRQILSDAFHCPVYIEHDASAAAIAEQYYGAGRGEKDFIYVLVSQGIGSGVILDGKIYRGQSGRLGQLGHVIIDPEGQLCICGQYGCLEAIASVPVILATANRVFLRRNKEESSQLTKNDLGDLTIQMLAEKTKEGNLTAERIFSRAADHIAHAISIYATLFDIHLVILGGELPNVGDVFFNPLQESLKKYLTTHKNVKVIPNEIKTDAHLRGVSLLTIQELLRFV